MVKLSGRCLCRAVSWTYSGPITRRLVCHCESCQRATSSPFTAFVGLDSKHVTWTGEVNHYESSAGTYRGFCPTCGSRLYFRSEKWPNEIHLHTATLDVPEDYTPDAQVVMSERQCWLSKLDDVPKYEGFHVTPTEAEQC